MYHPHDDKGSSLLFSMVNNENRIEVHCSNNIDIGYVYYISGGEDHCASIVESIKIITKFRVQVDNYLDNKELIDLPKEILQKFSGIARAILKTSNHTGYALNMVTQVICLEANKLQNRVIQCTPPTTGFS